MTGTYWTDTNHNDFETVSYSNAGVPLWTNRYNGTGNGDDFPSAIAVDSRGNVFVTGTSFTANGAGDFATVKYSNAGVPLWTNRYGPGSASGIAVDGGGNVFVTGSGADYLTVAYSNSGYDGLAGDSDYAQRIAVDAAGNVFVTGYSVDAPCCPLIAALETIAYSNAGNLVWENRYYGPDNLQWTAPVT